MFDATPQGWEEARAWASQQPGKSPGTNLYDETLALYPETWEALHRIGIERKKAEDRLALGSGVAEAVDS